METLAHTPAKVGQRFSVYNGDAIGRIVSVNSQEVAYKFEHDLETTHVHSRSWLNDHTYPVAEKVSK